MYSYNTVVVNSKLLLTSSVPDSSPNIASIFYSDGTGVPSGPGLYILEAGAITPIPVSTGGGSGTVTSVGLSMPSIFSVTGSPVNVSGTLTASLVSQTANRVFASPDSVAGIPTFRSLVINDIPTIPNSKLANSSISTVTNSLGTDISITPSVSLGGTLTLSVPDADTLARGVVNTGMQTFAGQKTFSTPPILSTISTGKVLYSGASNIISGTANLCWDIATNRLGINAPVPTANLHISGTMRVTGTIADGSNSVGTAGQVLSSTGSNTAWITPNPGTVTSVGLSAPSMFVVSGSPVTGSGTLSLALATQNANRVFAGPTTGAAAVPTFRSLVVADLPTGIPNANLLDSSISVVTGSTGTDFNISGSPVSLGGTLTINIPTASSSARGLVSTASQTFSGQKTFSAAPIIIPLATGGVMFMGTSNVVSTNANFFWDNSNSRLGIGNSTPSTTLHVTGGMRLTGTFADGANAVGTAGQVLSSTGTATSWITPTTGTVTSVGLSAPSILVVGGSPITSSGTISLTLATQAANLVFSGPTTGAAAVPTFRSLVVADLPTGIPNANLLNSSISVATGTTGTDFNVSGSPVSLGGTVTLNIPSASATARGLVTTGAQTIAGQKTFSSAPIVSGLGVGAVVYIGSSGEISANTNLFWDNTNTRLGIGNSAPSTTLHVTGSMRLTGTFADGANAVGTAGQVLSSTGTATSWITPTTGTVTSVGLSAPSILVVGGSPITSSGTISLTLATQAANLVFSGPTTGAAAVPTFRSLVVADLPTGIPNANLLNSSISVATGTTGTDFNVSGSPVSLGGTVTLNIPSASATARGLVTTGAQTLAGQKTFSSAPILSTISSGGVLFSGVSSVVSSNTNFFWDNTNTRLGIGNSTPSTTLHVTGSMRLTGTFADGANAVGTAGQVLSSTGTATSWITPTTGTVTSVGLSAPSILVVGGSPITSSGTISLTFATQAANLVFSGPTTGAAAVPTFRSLVVADLPTGIPNANLLNSSISVATGTTGTDFNVSGSPVSLGGTVTLNIPSASATARGLVTTAAQTLAGQKTFSSAPILSTISSGGVLFSGVSSVVSANTNFFWDNTNTRLGIGNSAPSTTLHVTGSMRLTGTFADGANAVGTAGQVLSSTGTATSWTTLNTIYTGNSTLTSNRTVDGGGLTLTFSNLTSYTISSTLTTIGGWQFATPLGDAMQSTSSSGCSMQLNANTASNVIYTISANNSGAGNGTLFLTAKTAITLGTGSTAIAASGPTTFNNSAAFTGTMLDISNSPGTSGQLLTSTGTGISWQNANTASVNIYNSDGSITANRTITGGGFNVSYNNIGTYTITGTTTSCQTTNFETNIIGGRGSATFSTGIAMGTGGNLTGSNGNSVGGKLNITTGSTGLTTGTICTITLPRPLPSTNYYIVVSPGNTISATHGIRYFASPVSTTTFTLTAGTTLSASTLYVVYYNIVY